MKYIDAEKLIAEIKRYKNKADERLKIKGRTLSEEQKDLALQNLCGNLLHFISSLQQEQPEVDLEGELDKYLRGEFQQTAGGNFNNYIQVARHFAEWGAIHLNARKEE